MKTRISVEKAEPVPMRGEDAKRWKPNRAICAKKCVKGIVAAAAFLILAGASIYVGIQKAPQTDIPVALADGSVITPPYYITVDGKRTVLVESKEAAEKTVQKVIEEYEGDPEDVIDVYVEESTGAEKMEIKTGDDLPDILTVEEAKGVLLGEKDGLQDSSNVDEENDEVYEGSNEDAVLTVIVTREETDIETISYEEKYSPSSELYIGESEVQTEGAEGIKEVTKKTVTENGETIETEILEEDIIKEPVERIVLKGTKSYDGQGGGSGASDPGVSYDENAAYDLLKTPVPSVNISSPFGPRWGRFHSGVDFALAQGQPIYASDGGTVYYSGYCGGYGKLIKIDHGNGMQTYYAHCSSLLVSAGQQVEAGETIGFIGSTGNSTGPHLHFEVIINGSRVDPLDFLDL